MRAVADGWFFSFTRVACCSFGQPENFSHNYMGRIQTETKGNYRILAKELFVQLSMISIEVYFTISCNHFWRYVRLKNGLKLTK